jgi:hypothetical protein
VSISSRQLGHRHQATEHHVCLQRVMAFTWLVTSLLGPPCWLLHKWIGCTGGSGCEREVGGWWWLSLQSEQGQSESSVCAHHMRSTKETSGVCSWWSLVGGQPQALCDPVCSLVADVSLLPLQAIKAFEDAVSGMQVGGRAGCGSLIGTIASCTKQPFFHAICCQGDMQPMVLAGDGQMSDA